MKKFIAIVVCKILRFMGKILKKGSSFPGEIALKICPDILEKIKMPKYVLAITGSNGKTSTVEMIAHIFIKNSKKVAFNREGSNQIQGIATFILEDCDLFGRSKSDIFLLETDEHFAKHTFKFFKPTHFLITNLYRDQLTRNGNPEWVYKSIQKSLNEDMVLILNANDPLTSCYSFNKNKTFWFGFDILPSTSKNISGAYNDGIFCYNCKSPLNYEFYHYNHIGKFSCDNCGIKTNKFDYKGSQKNKDQDFIIVNDKHRIKIPSKDLPISYSYNMLAAFSAVHLLGISSEKICNAIDNFTSFNSRVIAFNLEKHKAVLLVSKHENSVSYDQSLNVVKDYEKPCTVVIIVDIISRKYFTSDISWFYDINFSILKSENVKKIALLGFYSNDLATCLLLKRVPTEKTSIFFNIEEGIEYLKTNVEGKIFVITCFSDKDRFLKKAITKEIQGEKNENTSSVS